MISRPTTGWRTSPRQPSPDDSPASPACAGRSSSTTNSSRAMAREIAGDAAATVAREARAGGGRAAAREAARAALAPTLAELRSSVFGLLERMLPTVPLALPVAPDATQVCGVWRSLVVT